MAIRYSSLRDIIIILTVSIRILLHPHHRISNRVLHPPLLMSSIFLLLLHLRRHLRRHRNIFPCLRIVVCRIRRRSFLLFHIHRNINRM